MSSSAIRTSYVILAFATLLLLPACSETKGDMKTYEALLAEATKAGTIIFEADVKPENVSGKIEDAMKPLPADIKKLLASRAPEEALYKAVRSTKTSMLLLKRPNAGDMGNRLVLGNRLGLGLDTKFFDVVWRDSKKTLLTPIATQFALTPPQWQKVFNYLRGFEADVPPEVTGNLPRPATIKVWIGKKTFTAGPAGGFKRLLQRLRNKIGTLPEDVRHNSALTITMPRRQGVFVSGSKKEFRKLYVKGVDGFVWQRKGKSEITITPEELLNLNINNGQEVAEQFVSASNGNALTLAERRKRARRASLKDPAKRPKPLNTKLFYDPLQGTLRSLRTRMMAQASENELPRHMINSRYPAASVTTNDLSPDLLSERFLLGADFLVTQFKPREKMWHYEYHVQDGTVRRGRYNIIRHNLATFTMIQAYELTGDKKYLDVAQKAIEWVLALKKHEAGKNICYFNHKKYDRRFKLGGVGTFLYALVEFTKLKDMPQWNNDMVCFGNFLTELMTETGEYQYFYYPKGTKKSTKDKPVYIYPGEADLALVDLYRRTGDKKYLDTVLKSFGYYREWFKDNIKKRGQLGPYVPWAMSAFSELYKVTGNKEHLDYVVEMGDWLLEKTYPDPDKVYHLYQFGAYAYSMRVDSYPFWNTGVYGEGLASLSLFDKRFMPAMAGMFSFIMNLQLSSADQHLMKVPRMAIGGIGEHQFNYTPRLDYVYHCMAGVYRVLLAAQGPASDFPEGAKEKISNKIDWQKPVMPMPLPNNVTLLSSPFEKDWYARKPVKKAAVPTPAEAAPETETPAPAKAE